MSIKFVLCQPAIPRFKWELDVCITRLKSLGVDTIVLLFSKHNGDIPKYFEEKYGVETHEYEDHRVDKSYIPSIKPYLWSRYLEEDRSRENDTYFYMDSDVILREVPDVQPNSNVWYGSDCSSYLSIDYIDSKGQGIVEAMSNIIGIDTQLIRDHNPVCGAQWVIFNPTYEYWLKVYEDSNRIHRYFNSLTDSTIQKWTAEMWAQLWNVYLFDKVSEVHNELSFCVSTDPVEKYYETKMLHNAGVVDDHMGLFFKGKYVYRSPFDDDLYFVNRSKASIKYVDAIREVDRG